MTYMAFEKMRSTKPTRTNKCAYCKTKDRDGKVEIVIKDSDTKTVTSRSIGACEKCAIENYEKALVGLTPPEVKAA
jgi:hypothetical protein